MRTTIALALRALLAASAFAAPSAHAGSIQCSISPPNALASEGGELRLWATCEGGTLASIEWLRDGQPVSGVLPLSGDTSAPILYSAPVLDASGDFLYEVRGVGAGTDSFAGSASARVIVKPAGWTSASAPLGSRPSAPAAPSDGACSVGASASLPALPASLCLSGKPALVIAGPSHFSWSCLGAAGGSEASCFALNSASAPPPPPPPPAVSGSCGASHGLTLSAPPSSGLCSAGSPTAVATLASSYAWSCLGSDSAASSDDAACSASKASEPPPPPTGSDPGSGLWIPPGTTGRTFADQSGEATMRVTYAPGCLNGLYASSSSAGCAASTSFKGTANGSPHTVTFGSGNQVVLRYRSSPAAGSSVKYIRTRGYDGGNVGVNMRVWLSDNPSASYASIDAKCKQTSTRLPTVITGPGYCPILPDKVYYYGTEYDEPNVTRYQIDELGSDFR